MTLTETVDTTLLDFFTKRVGPEAIVDPELAALVVKLVEGEWQDISTAPKPIAGDGVYLDMYSETLGARWTGCFWGEESPVYYCRHISIVDGLRHTKFVEVQEPSHWRYSPPRPSRQGNQR